MTDLIKEFIIDNWFQISSTTGLIIAWIADRKKHKSETIATGASALDAIEDLQNKFLERYTKEYNELLNKVAFLETQVEDGEKLRKELVEKIEQFEKQSIADKILIEDLTSKVNNQQVTIDIQRKRINQLERTGQKK